MAKRTSVIQVFYQPLRAAGNAAKLTLVTCLRKLRVRFVVRIGFGRRGGIGRARLCILKFDTILTTP